MQSKPKLVVDLIQMNSQKAIDQNFSQAMDLLGGIASRDLPRLVVFPENFLYFGARATAAISQEILSYTDDLCEWAKNANAHIVLGTMPVSIEGSSKFYSRSLFIGSDGDIKGHYDKRHLFDVSVDDGHGEYRESDQFEPGQSTRVYKMRGVEVSLGMSICFDLRFPTLYQELRRLGANVIVVPSAFTQVTGEAHWEVLLRARAIETQSYVLACNQTGSHPKGRETHGHSMIIDPWGKVLSNAGREEGVCSADIDLQEVTSIRRKMPLKSTLSSREVL